MEILKQKTAQILENNTLYDTSGEPCETNKICVKKETKIVFEKSSPRSAYIVIFLPDISLFKKHLIVLGPEQDKTPPLEVFGQSGNEFDIIIESFYCPPMESYIERLATMKVKVT